MAPGEGRVHHDGAVRDLFKIVGQLGAANGKKEKAGGAPLDDGAHERPLAWIGQDDDTVVSPSLGETGHLVKPVASTQVGVEEHHLRRRLVGEGTIDLVRLAHHPHPAPERSQHGRIAQRG